MTVKWRPELRVRDSLFYQDYLEIWDTCFLCILKLNLVALQIERGRILCVLYEGYRVFFLFPTLLSLSSKTLATPLQTKGPYQLGEESCLQSWMSSWKMSSKVPTSPTASDLANNKEKGKAPLQKVPSFLEFFNFVVKYEVFVHIGDWFGDFFN